MNIVLVGAGPRNLSLVERLMAHAKSTTEPVDITLYDPFPIGGRVWNPDQDPTFLMNTVTQQLTLFTDPSVPNHASTALYGPNFYEWSVTFGKEYVKMHDFKNEAYFLDELTRINPNRFTSRALFGVYGQWFFEHLGAHVPANVTLSYERRSVTDVVKQDNQYTVTIDGTDTIIADQVVMALGHVDNSLNDEEQTFADAAAGNANMLYVAPTHPSEADLDAVPAREKVVLRGLGLSFFDYIAKLTISRGGRFARDNNGVMYYLPSGKEPHMIAGSRKGLPMHARGVNQKVAAEGYQPLFFTSENLDKLAEKSNGQVTYDEFFTLLRKELEYKHYQNTINDFGVTWPFNAAEFMDALAASDDLNETARKYGISEEYIMDWDRILNPVDDVPAEVEYSDFMMNYLTWDINDANQGNNDAPYAGAFDMLRDVRGIIRHYLDAGYLSSDEYAKFLSKFNPFNSLISVGPPVLRVEQMRALIEAGVLEVAGPGLAVSVRDDHYVATDNRGNTWTVNNLVEARLFPVSLAASTNPLVANLRDRGLLSAAEYTKADGSTYVVGGTRMNKEDLTVIDANDNEVDGLFIWGVPTEGWSWFTTFAPRSGVNDKNLRDAENIARRIFGK
ncbi:FAD/NAD(P)-binding protein [Weissella cibaria]|uniref:FAD/NAD(P)-binding protein n=1 Tax=Weissella cibaria TaxID=137591 RepID=UPI00143FAEFA|nr:FAD/NAD(P)-binding protein [Weissella cibaria]NKN29890.1 FAD/NAD(P)-binding protein [Weissella cibaria]NKN78785.1 FAD/NAD(P)-binding protein [Weissella cibaria]NKN96709.1 FAD/NAD(P)-binding protein [Weissella cibaria]NKN99065.1 FAD/NAD(P)-binding protein [Weissella cibaria]